MATPTKCEEKRPEGANPRTGYRARLLGKETYAYTAPGAMDTRDDRTTMRSGAEEKEEGTAPQEKGRGRNAPAKKAPGRGETTRRIPEREEEGGEGARKRAGRPHHRPGRKRRPRDPGGEGIPNPQPRTTERGLLNLGRDHEAPPRLARRSRSRPRPQCPREKSTRPGRNRPQNPPT